MMRFRPIRNCQPDSPKGRPPYRRPMTQLGDALVPYSGVPLDGAGGAQFQTATRRGAPTRAGTPLQCCSRDLFLALGARPPVAISRLQSSRQGRDNNAPSSE